MMYPLPGLRHLLAIGVFACIVVLCAMVIDLVSGVQKAKERGEARTSYGLKRSVKKFILYEGSMLIAIGVDALVHLSQLLKLFHADAVYGAPVVTCILGIFLLFIELKSVREKADEKTKKDILRAERLAAALLSKQDVKDAIKEVIFEEEKEIKDNGDKNS